MKKPKPSCGNCVHCGQTSNLREVNLGIILLLLGICKFSKEPRITRIDNHICMAYRWDGSEEGK